MAARIAQVFLGVSMQYQHDGLTKIAEKNKCPPDKLQAGDFLVFINRSHDKVKVMAAVQRRVGLKPIVVLAYTRLPSGARMNLEAIQYIPAAFTEGVFDYDKALEQTLKEALSKKLKSTTPSPLVAARKLKEAGIARA